MDAQFILAVSGAGISFLTAVVVLVTNVWNLRAAALARQAAERAEVRALESLKASEKNAQTLTRVATASQLNGRLTEFKRIVQEEANARIRAAEKLAEQAFVKGVESQRSLEPVATAAAVEEIKQLVTDALPSVEEKTK